jgi:TetR/AcrR family transcriptional regulator, hemagglutinin/protease regulatory protein
MNRKENIAAAQNPRRLAPEARRRQLLDCALTVFARRGIGEARHAEIAREAGMSVPTVFNYFPTREALVQSVLDDVGRFILDDILRPIQDDQRPAPEVLHDSALAFANAVEAYPDYARVWLDWSTAVRDDVWPRYLEFQDRVFALLGATTERGKREATLPAELDTEDAVRLLVGSAHMIAQMQIAGSDPARVRQFIASIIEGFIFRPTPAA